MSIEKFEASVERELILEDDARKINEIIVSAGRESTLNKALFFIGLWKICQLKPWEPLPMAVDEGEIDSWYDYKRYLSERTFFSPSSMDDAVRRINYYVENGTAWPVVADAIVRMPMAIDDMQDAGMEGPVVAALAEELIQLPNGAEARKRVAQELGRHWFTPVYVGDSENNINIEIAEMDGEHELERYEVSVTSWDKQLEELPEDLLKYIRSRFKVKRGKVQVD